MEEFREKTEDEIKRQLDLVENATENEITPVSLREDVGKLSAAEMKRLYPERYRLYVELLRKLKKEGGENLPEDGNGIAVKAHALTALDEMLHGEDTEDIDELYERQQETLTKTHQCLEKGITRGHVTLPTGVGKTVIFSKLVKAFASHPKGKVLVVGPTKTIQEQNEGKIETYGGQTAGRFFGGKKDTDSKVTLTTYQSFIMQAERLDLDSFDLIILDESHRALSEARVELINSLKKPVIVGFSATPEFHEEKKIEDILDYEIDSMTIKEAVEEGLLSSMKVYVVHTEADIEVERVGADFDTDALTKAIDTPERNKLVVNTYCNSPQLQDRKAVAYCVTRDHARRIAQEFNSEDVKAAYIGGDLTDLERENLLTQFRQGDLEVLCNADLLIEGFDAEEAEVCLNVTPTLSKVNAEQRGGRVLRRDKNNSRKVGKIIEFIDGWKEGKEMPVLFSEIAGAAELGDQFAPNLPGDGERDDTERKPDHLRTPPEKGPDLLETDPELVMSVTKKFRAERIIRKYEYAPLSWSNSRNLAKETHTRENSIVSFAERFKIEKPEWFKKCLTSQNRLAVHYSPHLVTRIRREFLTDLRDKTNALEFAQKQEIPLGYVEELFMLVLEEKKGIACIQVGGDVYVDESVFAEWYERRERARELRAARKEERALGHLLEDEKAPDAEEKFNEETDESPSFTKEGEEPENAEEIKEEDAVSDDERELMRDFLVVHENNIEEEVYFEDQWQQIVSALEVLKFRNPRNAQLIELKYLENRPNEEIAEIMNLSIRYLPAVARGSVMDLLRVIEDERVKKREGGERTEGFERLVFNRFLERAKIQTWAKVINFARDVSSEVKNHSGFDTFYSLMKNEVDELFSVLYTIDIQKVPISSLQEVRRILTLDTSLLIRDICKRYTREIEQTGRRSVHPAEQFRKIKEDIRTLMKTE